MPTMLHGPTITQQFINLSSNMTADRPRSPLTSWDATSVSAASFDVVVTSQAYAPVPAVANTGGYLKAVHDFWYYRLHFLPPSIALGNLAGDVQRALYLWNAYFTPVNVESITVTSGQGITFTSTQVVPGAMGPLEIMRYDINVAASGEAVVNGAITWTIDGTAYSVPITGQRTTLVPFKPDWSGRVAETLQWNNVLTTSYDGTEQVASLTSNPRRIYDFNIALTRAADSQLFDLLMFGWTGRFFTVPIWNEQTKLTQAAFSGASAILLDTTHLSIAVGTSLMLYRDAYSYEIAKVVSFDATSVTLQSVIQGTWPAGTKAVPLMTARPEDSVSSTRRVDTTLEAALRFTGNPGETPLRLDKGTPDALYLGEELYTGNTNWREAMPMSDEARVKVVDNGRGPIRMQRKADYPLRTRGFSWLLKSRTEADWLRRFMARREGRRFPVWISSGLADLTLAADVLQGQASLEVEPSQYGTLIGLHPAMRHLLVQFRDGAQEPRLITSTAAGPQGRTIINLDSDFGRLVTPAMVKRISYLGYYRLGGDEVQFGYATDTVSEVSVNFVLKRPPA